jgi:hypothetical protein
MAKHIVTEIRDDYRTYNKLLKARKSIFEEIIEISKINNNANILEQTIEVVHQEISNKIILIINVKVNNYGFFQFKLRCKEYCQIPFFRYDSDGETHRNYDEDIPLEQQQITSPHFHYFNEKGINIAYKTSQLLNDKELQALSDIDICIKHFCHEANLFLKTDSFPDISILPSNLKLKMNQEDPTENVIFK